ncbi:MAG: alkaline shock response membrane anchor protein AmaP [Syntrophaceticus sp.]|nr:alkaline shock response membrane anchor protein AmaP [Syntrophaceticus sp.]MDD4782950.1 alkaline shock response membrane anchor protein AmaP [Syntrophaceticus sp.]HBG22914.1 alkaline shock response membrane anchor protein AmaP [Peptococcaceae bacterium]
MRRQYLFFQIISSLILILLSASALAVAFDYFTWSQMEAFLAIPANNWGLIAGSVLVLLFAIWALIDAFRGPSGRDVVIHESGLGRVEIADSALENVIRRAARNVREVREVKPILRTDQDGLVVKLLLNVNPDANLPEISKFVQEIVREQLEKKVGVQVSKVEVLIRSVATEVRPRVE